METGYGATGYVIVCFDHDDDDNTKVTYDLRLARMVPTTWWELLVIEDAGRRAVGCWPVGRPETGPGDPSHRLGSGGTGLERDFCLVSKWEQVEVC